MHAAARPYFPSFDGLRCLAILPIVWHHATPGPLGGVLDRGPLGVDLFFVLSGFLITSLLLHERASGGIALGAFWVRRSLRIFPLYYAVLAAFVLHALFLRAPGPTRDDFLRDAPLYATYTSNWLLYHPVDHPIVFAFAWSLAAEEQFYLVWPPLLRALPGRAWPAVAMGALVVLDQGAEHGWLLFGEGLAFRMIRSFATPIGLGSLLALAIDHPAGRRVAVAALGHRAAPPIALGLVVLAAVDAWPLLPTYAAMTVLVGACALARGHLLMPLLENRVVRHVGVVSYGIYLLNVPVVTAVKRIVAGGSMPPATHALLVFLIAMPASVAVATLAYRFIEQPFLALRESWSRRFSRSRSSTDVPRSCSPSGSPASSPSSWSHRSSARRA